MPVSYKREMNHNYMIVDSSRQDADGFECKMLSGNTIEGLLKFRVVHQEEKNEFFYEITSKQPLSRILNQRMITGSEIQSLLLSIAGTLRIIEEYLLKEEQIMLEPDYIYVEPDQFFVYLCMVPGYFCDFPTALTELLAYLVGKVNHQDREGVVLAYNLYHESLKENYGLADLLGHLAPGKEKIFGGERPERIRESETNRDVKSDRSVGEERAVFLRTDFGAERAMESQSKLQADREMKSQGGQERDRKAEAPNTSFLAIALQIMGVILPVAATVILLWVFTGTAGLLRYGIFAAGLVLLLVTVLSRLNSCKPERRKRKHVLVGEDKRNEDQQEGNGWRVVPEEKSDKDWTDWIESDNMEERVNGNRLKEPETTLLTERNGTSQKAVLESLTRERESIAISYLPFVIGKHAELADYCLPQTTVSRLHMRIDKKEGVYIATDLNSTNGTIVEGYHLQANETVSIKNGDTIYIADAGYRFLDY